MASMDVLVADGKMIDRHTTTLSDVKKHLIKRAKRAWWKRTTRKS